VLVPPAGQASELARAGAEIAASMLAKRGRPLSLRFAAAGGAEGADRAAAKLLEEGAELLLSASGEEETASILGLCERRGAPLIVCAANEPRLTDRGARMIVRLAPTTSQLVGRGLGLLRDLHERSATAPPKRVTLVHTHDAAGRLLRASLAAILPAALTPAPVLTQMMLPPGPDGGERIIPALRETTPDVVVIEAAERAAACVAAIVANGVRPAGIVAFGHPGLLSPEVFALPDKAGEGHVTFAPWADPASPVTAEVRSLYERRRPRVPFELAQGELALAVDSVLLAAETATRNPDARGPALAAALRGSVLATKMLRGPPLRFDQRGQNLALPSVALQNRPSRPVVVLPRDFAEEAAVWPNPLMMKS
jgi:hypothetical protein